ncbi:hypothetical protein SGQ44_01195 [Flavobacterium sp. Fl-77]|uniref:Uncharacterized protein n=1 Tax=Flavobacterium flavipigmentatum TaxID=2893884 RepID=A0AAJ2VWP5_9FLAO|nr:MULTISPECIES: hypothetical protein [unclassified Flavobacterium]MDX6180750.1 hypothetical protein [Flavobacterium sp. Fl-33]MDX6184350.1 hypothetical protein [Flavobacterium sp. Fl-77]UFH39459.1 hypothetical protein LNP22_04090 [Flavobacterium sp. F-70]
MENARIEAIYNETFSGLKLFYRDTNLTENLISNYKIGQIIKERGFTDMTFIGGGLSGNFRYLIASADAKDLSKFDPDAAKTGHYLLASDAYFKVLDIQQAENKTQVFLLNIPDNAVSLFKNSISNIEEEIIEKAQKRFADKINSDLILALQTEDWIERTKLPIGMSLDGEMFFNDSEINESPQEIAINKNTKKIEIKKPWWKIW